MNTEDIGTIGADQLFLELCGELFSAAIDAGRAEAYGYPHHLEALMESLPPDGMAQRLIQDGIALGRAEVSGE